MKNNHTKDQTKPSYLKGNIDNWTERSEAQKSSILRRWEMEPCWGMWKTPDKGLDLLPSEMTGLHALEIGCGTGYVSSWMAQKGANVTGIDPTAVQIETAREMSEKHNLKINFLEAYGENLPFEDASFDFAISEYGSSLWSDPYLWLPEASRVIRKGGKLVFLTNSIFFTLTCPDLEDGGPPGYELLRPYQGIHKVKWPDTPEETEFHLTHGKWIELLNSKGFRIDALHELSALPNANGSYDIVTKEWASKYPAEEIWVCTRI